MSNATQLLTSILISVLMSLLVLRALSAPLANVITHLCPHNTVGFWLRYTQVMLTLAPLIAVLLADMFAAQVAPLAALRLTLLAAIGGLVLGLMSIGSRVLEAIPRPAPAFKSPIKVPQA